MPQVNPDILRWARETAGLSPAEAAKKVALAATKKFTAAERIEALESGEDEPTRPLLSRMAKQYRRPLVAFYLATPPRKGDRGEDFRTLPDDHDVADEILLDALLRDIRARQRVVRSALDDEDPIEALPFVGSLTVARGVLGAAAAIRETLAVSLADYRHAQTSEAAFRLLRERAEALGVFVILLGNLGSHHTALSLETFRGVAIADPIAPFIVINDQDSRAAWSFSLIHELTHLFLGQTGVSGGRPDRGIERFCDSVAAEFLLPTSEVIGTFQAQAPRTDQLAEWISAAARRWKVSRTMIAYRLYSVELIEAPQWHLLRTMFKEQWIANRERRRQLARDDDTGPSYYVVRRQRLGDAILNAVSRTLASGLMSTSKAAQVLGVKPTNVGPLLGIEAAHSPKGD